MTHARQIVCLIALAFCVSSAVAQTSPTRAQLESQINGSIRANGQGAITGPILNGIMNSQAASTATLLDQNTFAQPPIFIGQTGYAYANGWDPVIFSSTLSSGTTSAGFLIGSGTTFASGLTIPSPTVSGTFTVGQHTSNAILSFLDAAVVADTTSLTIYNPTMPFTSTTTYAGLLANLGANVSIESLPTYDADAIAGMTVQTNTSSLSFPTGVTGIGVLNGAGNYAFGDFAQCFQFTTGSCVGAEFNTWNEHADANANFPLTGGFPNTQTEPNALQLVAFGGFTAKAAVAIGSGVNNGGTPKPGFQAGIYMDPLATSEYGIYVDASASESPATAARFRTSGAANAMNLQLQTMGSLGAGSEFIDAFDLNGVSVFSLDTAGNFTSAALAGSGTVVACINSAGKIVRGASSTSC